MLESVEDIGNLLILVESTPVEEEDGVVEVDGVAATGEDTRIIVIIKVLLLRFMPFLDKQFKIDVARTVSLCVSRSSCFSRCSRRVIFVDKLLLQMY